MIIHQSDLSSWARCPAQYGYKRAGWKDETNSAAAYGSVMHHSLNLLERLIHEKVPFQQAVQQALETFVYYWNPLNIEAICEPVPSNGWLPRQGYSELRARGIDAIKKYADLIRYDEAELLATEYGFMVPIEGTWDYELEQPHILAGAVDRMVARYYKRELALGIDDWKTGKEYRFLRHNLQFTAYCYASTLPEFWTGWGGEDGYGQERGMQMYERFHGKGRRGTWINMRTFKFEDAGWRGEKDFQRFKLAVDQITASIQADIFPLTINGEACKYCPYRASCGGIGVPEDTYGAPK